jgi:hypothetical protein
MSKTIEEISKMKQEDLVEFVASLSAKADDVDKKHEEAKKAMEEKHKEAIDNKEKESKKALDEEHKKNEATLKAVLKAMEEDDPEKRKEAVKAAIDHKDDEHKEGTSHDDEEKKAMKAEITYLAAELKKPKIEYLAKVYQAANTPEDKLKEYVADWETKTAKQLDAAIEQVKPLIDSIESVTQFEANKTEKSPFGFSTASPPTSSKTFAASKEFEKIEKMSTEDLFANGGSPYA